MSKRSAMIPRLVTVSFQITGRYLFIFRDVHEGAYSKFSIDFVEVGVGYTRTVGARAVIVYLHLDNVVFRTFQLVQTNMAYI